MINKTIISFFILIAFWATMPQNSLATSKKVCDVADVNGDGLIYSADIMFIYNRIMYGSDNDDNNLPVQNAVGQTSAKLAANEQIALEDFPYYIKKGNNINFFARFATFDTLVIGRGYKEYQGAWMVVDRNKITVYREAGKDILYAQFDHNLNIRRFLDVDIDIQQDGKWHVKIDTYHDSYECHSIPPLFDYNGKVFAFANRPLANVELYARSTDLSQTVWAFGDSYFGVYPSRWVGVIKQMGYFNFMVNGKGGLSSDRAFADLQRALKSGCPKYLLWCLGMNDSDEMFKTYFDQVKAMCEEKGITLICSTIPTVPKRSKEFINSYIKASGVRYIDFYKALGANSKGEWHEGYLEESSSQNRVHPTALGAQALARQVLIDMPEFEQYCKTK